MQVSSIMGGIGALPDRGSGKLATDVYQSGDGEFESLVGRAVREVGESLIPEELSETMENAAIGDPDMMADGDYPDGQVIFAAVERTPTDLLPDMSSIVDAWQVFPAAVTDAPTDADRIAAQTAPVAESGRNIALTQPFAVLADLQAQETRSPRAIAEPGAARSGTDAAGAGQAPGTLIPAAATTAQVGPIRFSPPLPAAPANETAEPAEYASPGLAEETVLRNNHRAHRTAATLSEERLAPGPVGGGGQPDLDPKTEDSGRLAPLPDDAGLRTQTLLDHPRSSHVAHAADERQARHVAHQLATGFDGVRDRPTEIILDPEELGRLRMSLQMGDAAITMFIQAERPETADLMRRHLDQLAQEFRALGYQDVTFHFADKGGQGSHAGHDLESPEEDHGMMSVAGPQQQNTTLRALSGALDLRL